jgi:hypothetical protein
VSADALQRFEVWFGCLFVGIGLVALVIAAHEHLARCA